MKNVLKNVVYYINQCESTNDEIKKYCDKNSQNIVYTFNQTQGRGQYSNYWDNSFNENLALSIAIPSNRISINEVCLRFYYALILQQFVSAYIKNENVYIKYPNDIFINNKKIAGILIEKTKIDRCEYYIIGIGINVLQKKFINLPNASSIQNYSSKNINLQYFTNKFIEFICNYKILSEVDIFYLINKNLYQKNKVIAIKYQNKIFNAICKEITMLGEIIFDIENMGIKKLKHKEFMFL